MEKLIENDMLINKTIIHLTAGVMPDKQSSDYRCDIKPSLIWMQVHTRPSIYGWVGGRLQKIPKITHWVKGGRMDEWICGCMGMGQNQWKTLL